MKTTRPTNPLEGRSRGATRQEAWPLLNKLEPQSPELPAEVPGPGPPQPSRGDVTQGLQPRALKGWLLRKSHQGETPVSQRELWQLRLLPTATRAPEMARSLLALHVTGACYPRGLAGSGTGRGASVENRSLPPVRPICGPGLLPLFIEQVHTGPLGWGHALGERR